MTNIILEPLDEEGPEISLGNIELGGGFTLEPESDSSEGRTRRQSSGGGTRGTFAPSDDGYIGIMNRGILGGLTAPLDAVDSLMDTINSPLDRLFLSEEGRAATAASPSETITDLFRSAGGAVADADLDTSEMGILAQTADFVGDTLGLAPYMGVGLAAVPQRVASSPTATQGVLGMAQGAANMMQRSIVAAPKSAAAAEVGAGVGGGLFGAIFADRFGEEYRSAGEVGGAMGLPMAPAAATAALRGTANALRPVSFVGESLDRLAGTFSGDTFSRRKARETLVSSSEDFETAIGRLRTMDDPLYQAEGGLDLSPMERTGDVGLLNLQARLAANDPTTKSMLRARESENMSLAEELLLTNAEGQRGNVQAARQTSADAVADQRQAIGDRVDAAVAEAHRAIERAGPLTVENKPAASAIMYRHLDAAKTEADATVKATWAEVPSESVGLRSTLSSYEDVVRKAGPERDAQIPALARRFLDPQSGDYYGEAQDAKRLFNLYSQLREDGSNAARAGKLTEASFANQIADAVLKDISAHEPMSELYSAARNATLAYHKTFTRGPVGAILNPAGRGETRTNEFAALDKLLNAGGPAGQGQEKINLDAISRALGPHNPEPYRAAEDYVRISFTDAVAPGSSAALTPERGAAYLQRHNELFTRYPHLKGVFEETIDAARHADTARAHGKNDMAALDASLANRFSNSAVDAEFAAILKTPDPVSEVRGLTDVLLSQDPTGVAVEGLRQTARNHLVKQMIGEDPARGTVLKGTAYANLMRDRRNVFSELLGPDELAKMDALSGQLRSLEVGRGMSPQEGQIVKPSVLVQALSRFVTLKTASPYIRGGPTSLTQSSAVSRLASSISDRMTSGGAERLLQEAVKPGNERILLDLMTPPQNAAQEDRLVRSISAWLSTLPVSATSSVEEDNSDGDIDSIFEGLGVSR